MDETEKKKDTSKGPLSFINKSISLPPLNLVGNSATTGASF